MRCHNIFFLLPPIPLSQSVKISNFIPPFSTRKTFKDSSPQCKFYTFFSFLFKIVMMKLIPLDLWVLFIQVNYHLLTMRLYSLLKIKPTEKRRRDFPLRPVSKVFFLFNHCEGSFNCHSLYLGALWNISPLHRKI